MRRSEIASTVEIGHVLLDRYRIQRFLTLGGTSVLYLAEDQRLGRTVCIKTLQPAGGDRNIERTTREHFVQEAFALSRLLHPNTLRIYDFGHFDVNGQSMPFQVLEFVNGGTLAARIREQGPLSGAAALAIVTQLAGALTEVHAFGIVHRDVKPNNILLVGKGNEIAPKLADFGIAKATTKPGEEWADDTALVAGHEVRMYSVNWSAPEQFTSLDVTPATDVYALGLVIIYMLTGKVLFETEESQQALPLRRNVNRLIERTFAGRPASDELLSVLSAACRFDAQRRLSDPRELAIRLAEALGSSSSPGPRADLFALGRGDATSIDIRPSDPPHPPVSLDADAAPRVVGDRAVEVAATTPGYVNLTFGQQARVRVRFLDDGNGSRMVHLKGLNCFVARAGGRPTVAVQVDRACSTELVSADHRILGQLSLRFAREDGDFFDFQLANQRFALRRDRYDRAVALDAGPGGACVFVVNPQGDRP